MLSQQPSIPEPFDPVAHLGAMVRAERMRQKINQQALADLAGTGVRFVRDLESGKKPTLQLNKILAVANVLGMETLPLGNPVEKLK